MTEWQVLIGKAIAANAIFLVGSIFMVWFVWRARIANQRSRLLFRNASDGLHILDPKHNLIEASDAFCSMLGYTQDEMIGMNASKWDLKSTRGEPARFAAQIGDPFEILTFETQFCRKDGQGLDVEVTVHQMTLTGQQLLFCAARDITRRKRTELALLESEARFRKFFEENNSVMLIVEPSSGEIVAASRAASSYYGHFSERLIGMSVNQINTLPVEEVAIERQRALREERDHFSFRHRLASGEQRDVEVYSSPIDVDGKTMLFSIVHDVSERKASEARARRLSDLYAALSQCNQAIVHCADEAELFSTVCRCTVDYGFAKTTWIGFADEASKQIEPVAWFGDGNDLDFLKHIPLTLDESSPHGQSLVGAAIRNNEPQWCQDFLEDSARALWHEFGRNAGWKSVASLPLSRHGLPVGCLVLYADAVNAFDQETRRLLTEMAMDISFALDNFAREADRLRSANALQASETRYRLVFQTSQDVITINRLKDGVYIDASNSFFDVMGFDREEIIGVGSLDLNIWVNPLDREIVVEKLRHASGCRNMKAQFRKRNGELLWGLMSASIIELDGEPCVLAVTRDISDIKTAEEEIKNLAFFDPLTRLPNRRLLTDRLHQAVAFSVRKKRKCALLFIDLDNFKTLNDSSGHVIGDLLLREVAKRLTACVRETDSVARFGGDEFIVLIEDMCGNTEEGAVQARAIGEKILAVIAHPYLLDGREYRSSTSIGITIFGGQHESLDDLMTQADIAMYQAKSAGRNTLRFFSPELQDAINSRVSMEEDLRRAIESEQFLLYYQPQLDSGSLVGAEALIRWNHPDRGIVMPNEFISVAEETGMILPLGQWVLETACGQIADWGARQDSAHIVLAVNVSVLQFRQPDFVEQTLEILQRTGAAPQRLKLELTESMLVDNVEDVIAKMTTLRSRGVTFSLDDFGTGYSSLSYLKRLPLDQLKIDRSFVKDVLTDTNDAAIAKTIVALGQTMGLSVIAEGVETEAQRDFLSNLGCHAFQGFLFGNPVPLEEFHQLIKFPSY